MLGLKAPFPCPFPSPSPKCVSVSVSTCVLVSVSARSRRRDGRVGRDDHRREASKTNNNPNLDVYFRPLTKQNVIFLADVVRGQDLEVFSATSRYIIGPPSPQAKLHHLKSNV